MRTAGHQAVWSMIDGLAASFESELLKAQSTACEQSCTNEGSLFKPQTWLSILPHPATRPAEQTADHVLLLGHLVQGTDSDAGQMRLSYAQGIVDWQRTSWQHAGLVHLNICSYKEEGLYLQMRHHEFPSLEGGPQGTLLTALRLCWRFALNGGTIGFEAPSDFWNQEIAKPFRACNPDLQPVSLELSREPTPERIQRKIYRYHARHPSTCRREPRLRPGPRPRPRPSSGRRRPKPRRRHLAGGEQGGTGEAPRLALGKACVSYF